MKLAVCAGLAVLILALGACDTGTETGGAETPRLADPHDSSVEDIVEPLRTALGAVRLEVSDAPGAGRSVSVVAVVEAEGRPVRATLSVYSPELERAAAAAHRAPSGGRPAATRVGARPSRELALRQGEVHRERVRITFDEPGLYTIAADLVLEPEGPASPGLADDTYDGDRTWVWVGESGVEVLDRPDLSVVPRAWVGALGPARAPDEPPAFVAPATARLGGAYAQVRVVYEKVRGFYDPVEYVPLVGAVVRSESSSGRVFVGATDADGYATILCADGAEQSTVEVKTTGQPDVNVAYDPNGWVPWNHHGTALEIQNPPCGQALEVEADAWMSNTFALAKRVYRDYVSEFGRTPAPQDIFLKKNSSMAVFDVNNNIVMGDERFDVVDPTRYYYFLVGHEYGHAYHYRALGGMPRGKCGDGSLFDDSHFFDGADNHKCAYTEGFASFAAAVSASLSSGDLFGLPANRVYNYSRVARRTGYPGAPERARSGRESYSDDGSVIEGAFAAFMWDLYDPAGAVGEDDESGYDAASYPLSYIADVMRTCQYVVDGTSRPEDGTDRLITCFRRQRVPHGPSFFRLRYDYGDHVYSFTEGAAEPPGWSRTAIDNLWRYNFYDLGPLPLSAQIQGPHELQPYEWGTFTAVVSGHTGPVSYEWCRREIVDGNTGSGAGSGWGDSAPTFNEWTCGATGPSMSDRMSGSASRLEIRLTVSQGGGSATTLRTVYPSSGEA